MKRHEDNIDHKGLTNIELLALKLSLIASINFPEVVNCSLKGQMICLTNCN